MKLISLIFSFVPVVCGTLGVVCQKIPMGDGASLIGLGIVLLLITAIWEHEGKP